MKSKPIPYGKIISPTGLGSIIRQKRKEVGIDQIRGAGLAGVGVRFLSELERGKPTVEFGLVLQVLQRFGLELWVKPKGK